MKRALVLFTNDLRVHDQPALAAALAESEQVVPLFVLDRLLLSRSCGAPNRVAFLLESLHDLAAALERRGGALAVRHGDVVAEAIALARRWRAQTIHIAGNHSPYAVQRQERLARACRSERVELRVAAGTTIVAPGQLAPGEGDHYRVFTPYWRAWSERPLQPATPTPRRVRVPEELGSSPMPAPATIAPGRPSPQLQRGGERAGRERLKRWLAGGLGQYSSRHDDLAAARTSGLSPYLHFGCLSAREVRARAEGHTGAAGFVRQLCWRDFHHQVLAARPDLPSSDYRPRGDRWHRGARVLEAWRDGRTGYPIVDAGMRQLAREGYMHNRARLIVGSFLTKTLYVDWRRGAAHFATLLQDADVAENVGNWQWVAGTGNDTRPNRVLNPLRQAQRFDPGGDYVRRYVPELAGVPGAAVHEPWRLDGDERRRLDYPQRIVDHEQAARELRARRR